MQESIVLDYNVTSIISTSILEKLKDFTQSYVDNLITTNVQNEPLQTQVKASVKTQVDKILKVIQTEIMVINYQTGDYVQKSPTPQTEEQTDEENGWKIVYKTDPQDGHILTTGTDQAVMVTWKKDKIKVLSVELVMRLRQRLKQ